MGEVMSLRLTDQLREAQGETYSPSVTYNHSLTWTGWGYVAASVEVPASKLDQVVRDIDKIAADLKAKAPTPDELDRAKKPRLDQLERARMTNQYWLNELSNAQSDPRKLDFIRQIIPGTERVTAADVQRAAATWLDAGKAYRVVVKPK
jgi:zinc protease